MSHATAWLRPLIFLLLVHSASAWGVAFPRPAELKPDIDFWIRIYSEVETTEGLVHDSRRLDIVYERLKFPSGMSERSRERRIKQSKEHYKAILRTLATGKRKGLGPEERRVLALWKGANHKTLADASLRLRFQLGQADRFREGLVRSGAWREYIADTFASMSLPGELAVLPHVESSFNPKAYSHAGAAGMWQFTRYTGKRFLNIDHVVDERMDPYLSTVAAGRLLAENYKSLRSWPLALTAYNHGVAGMRRAVRKVGTADFATIVREYRSRTFGFASRNFYLSFLAALEVERNAERYFGPVRLQPAVTYETITLDHFATPRTLARALGVNVDTLAAANPALRRTVWKGDKYIPAGYALRLPLGRTLGEARQALASIPAHERYTAQRPDLSYRVQRGDTLSGIAAKFGVSTRSLADLNGLRSRHRIRIGQIIRLPPVAGGRVYAATVRQAPPADGLYRVRRGDSLSRISQRFGVSARQIAHLNGLVDTDHLSIGQSLRLPVSGAGSVAAASVAGPASYRVRNGDTLSLIAQRFKVGVSELVALNGLSNQHRIHIGQRLALPVGIDPPPSAPVRQQFYMVRSGDTLSAIAHRFRLSERQLAALNDLNDRHRIYPGQKLVLVAQAPSTTAVPTQLANPAVVSAAPSESAEPPAPTPPVNRVIGPANGNFDPSR